MWPLFMYYLLLTYFSVFFCEKLRLEHKTREMGLIWKRTAPIGRFACKNAGFLIWHKNGKIFNEKNEDRNIKIDSFFLKINVIQNICIILGFSIESFIFFFGIFSKHSEFDSWLKVYVLTDYVNKFVPKLHKKTWVFWKNV